MIRMDEWKAEIERVMSSAGDEGLTRQELADHLGVSIATVCKRLGMLHRQGRLVHGRRRVVCADGVTRPTPVYRLKKEKK